MGKWGKRPYLMKKKSLWVLLHSLFFYPKAVSSFLRVRIFLPYFAIIAGKISDGILFFRFVFSLPYLENNAEKHPSAYLWSVISWPHRISNPRGGKFFWDGPSLPVFGQQIREAILRYLLPGFFENGATPVCVPSAGISWQQCWTSPAPSTH